MKYILQLLCICLPFHSLAAPSPKEIMEKAESHLLPHFEQAHYQMQLINAKGKKRIRHLQIYYRKTNKQISSLLKFQSPADIEGLGVLIEDKYTIQNDFWIYIPNIRRIRRVSAHQKSNWLPGTEYSYEDFEGFKIPYHQFNLLADAPCGNQQSCYQIEAKWIDTSIKTGYSKKIYFIDKRHYFPIATHYYDRNDALLKILSHQDLHLVDGFLRPKIQRMHNLQNNRKTILIAQSRQLDRAFSDYYVSKQFLEKE